ncbi:MAG TPA: ATP-binding cassette domain-containing protein [Jatrophihabitans sp.]|uniref:ATP-binding cassette domain-containing protein n=1 Tax=Jatrophihabitans sp. TaxID=1932789 RepID=UPI002DFEF176|nr:ATP-binding cassette domain-containing protein [Jatrophihabitans sp.]
MVYQLEARGIVKRYGHVEVLRGTDFTVEAGKVTALIGDNGAGKSTLVKILSGVMPPQGGEILLAGKPISLSSPSHARELGIETVYQDLALAPDLGPAENAYVGRELVKPGLLGKLGVLDKKKMRTEAFKTFTAMGTDVKDMDAAVAALSGGQKQSVAICRSVMWAKGLIFMDEPTAALGVRQTRRVLDLIRRVADRGIAVVLISHNMPEVLEVSDSIQVLRLGQRVAEFTAAEATVDQLVGAMTGSLELSASTQAKLGDS